MAHMPTSKTLPALLLEMGLIHGSREAVVDGSRRMTYAQLARAVDVCTRGLMALGVGRGDKVAVLMGNRLEWIVSALAATSIGAIAVAVNTWSTAREIAHALNLSEARFLICTPCYLKRDYVRDIETMRNEGQLPGLQTIVGVGSDLPASWQRWDCLTARSAHAQAAIEAPGPDDTAFILFTSGSTSHPKGVELAHRSLIENTWAIGERMGTTQQDRLWLAVSLFWGFGCSNALVNLLSHGGCIVLQESFDAGAALSLMERERCTLMYAMPNMVQALLDHPDYPKRDLSSLRSGATIGTPEQIRRAAKLAPAVCHVYGLTEVYGNCHVTDAADPLELRMRSAGKPLPGTRQRIVDPRTGLELKVGEVGELRVHGHVMKGYYKNAAQTTAAFDDQGFFRTGDLASIDANGHLFFRGRLKELVKTGGMNVSPAEVEAVLMSHPGVQLALVVGLRHPTRDEVLAAVIVPKAGHTLEGDELKEFCRRNLAVYKVPAAFHFSTEDALPLTTTGKIQKNRIADTFFSAEAQQ